MIRIIILGYHRQYTIKDVCGTCGVKEARENTTWEAVFGVQIIYKEAWEIVLSHHINNIWIDMETFQHFNKQLGTLHPSWLQDSPPHPPQPPPPQWLMLGEWACDSLFLSFLRLHFPPFFFTREKNRQRAVGGAIVLSNASLRKSSFSAGNGELKCQSRALWKCLLWTCRGMEAGLDDPSTSFPAFALPKP